MPLAMDDVVAGEQAALALGEGCVDSEAQVVASMSAQVSFEKAVRASPCQAVAFAATVVVGGVGPQVASTIS